MDLNQYKFTNRWYKSQGKLIKDFEIKNDRLIPIYLNSKEKKEFFEMKEKYDFKYKRNIRIKKLKRILS